MWCRRRMEWINYSKKITGEEVRERIIRMELK
jgi:hypothetical protein